MHHTSFYFLILKKWLALFGVSLGLSVATAPAGSDDALFCSTYQSCRQQFVAAASAAGARLSAIPVPSRADSDLTIDVAYLPPAGTPKKLIVMTSGVHGVEGYAGSAVQRLFLKEMYGRLDRAHTGVLLIHAVNPYGMKHGRRVSENNVDLNRNFDVDRSLFASPNEGYRKMQVLLNPSAPVATGARAKLGFYWRIARVLMHEPLAALRQAVLQGQYELERGLFYGGKDFEPQKAVLEKVLVDTAAPYEQALVLDLHTGYGSRGVLHLMGEPPRDGPARDLYESLFRGFIGRELAEKDTYHNKGDFSVFVNHLLTARGKRVVSLVLEYGTVDNQTTLGGVASLRTMVLENQLHWHGAQDEASALAVRRRFLAMFFPASASWRESFLKETRRLLPTVTARLAGPRKPPMEE